MCPPLCSPSSSLHTSRRTVFLCVTHTLVIESLLFSHSTPFTHCRILSEDCVLCAQSCIHRLCSVLSPQCSHMPLCPVLPLLLHRVPICHTSLYTVSVLSTLFPFSPSHILYPYSVSFNTCFLCIPFSVCSVLPSFHPLYVLFPHSPCVVYTLFSICQAATAVLSPGFHPL